MEMLRVWQAWRGGGVGAGHLPERGGVLDQAALMMDALAVMDAAWEELLPHNVPGGHR